MCGDVYNNTIDNCYFNSEVYSGKAVGGTESKPIGANVLGKGNSSFKCGEVAYLLSKGCTIDGTTYSGSAWGQRLTGDNKELSPVITSENAKTVYKVTFINGDAEYAVKYANPSGIYEMPIAPPSEYGYVFKWSISNTDYSNAANDFTANTAVAEDITVYAVKEEKYGEKSGTKTVTATCGTETTQDLSAYTVFAAVTSSIGKFTYTIESGNDTLGASISGDTLTIPSTAAAGEYTLTIKATVKEPVV